MHGHFQISNATNQFARDQHRGQDDRKSNKWFTCFIEYHDSYVNFVTHVKSAKSTQTHVLNQASDNADESAMSSQSQIT